MMSPRGRVVCHREAGLYDVIVRLGCTCHPEAGLYMSPSGRVVHVTVRLDCTRHREAGFYMSS